MSHKPVTRALGGPDSGVRQLLDGLPLVPAQLPARHDGVLGMPEAQLFVAVLQSAVDDLVQYRGVNDPRAQTLYRQAWEWMASDEEDGWPGRFRTVCEMLGLDVELVRRRWLRGDGTGT